MGKAFYLTEPAAGWEEGLPIGSGRLGAMIPGKIGEENILVNEESLWYGAARDRKNPDSRRYLEKVRKLLMEGKVEDAAFLWKMAFTSAPKYNNPYQPAGELHLCFKNHRGEAADYRRNLDLEDAQAEVSYSMNGHFYRRVCFASAKYRTLVLQMTTEEPGGMTVSANIARKPFEEYSGVLPADFPAVGSWGQNGAGGVHYLTAVTACAKNAEGGNAVSVIGDFLYIQNAKKITIYFTAFTDYEEMWDSLENGKCHEDGQEPFYGLWERVREALENALTADYDTILAEHREWYHRYFDRFSLNICKDARGAECVPMDKIMGEIRRGKKEYADYMIELLVDYARYLMISSSADCLLPTNLQGIWNGSFVPPWQSQYTININTEMNYWFVPKVGLTECEKTFRMLLQKMRYNGRKTAEALYGCRGFCAHHNTNLWACTDPEGIFDSSPFWNLGAAWMACQIYDQYRYSQDKELLENEILPVMREAILFLEDYLFEDQEKRLLSGPSVSPENTYETRDGQCAALSISPTMDRAIMRQLILDYQEGLTALKKAREEKLDELLEKIPDYEISGDGRILEWLDEVQETEPGHRHISHLFGLHPGNTITREKQELYKAAGRTLDYRLSHGGGHTGWSKAWICCFMARLGRGEELWENLFQMLGKCIQDNLLDVHPPFQIDGNFGLAEAVLEGIVQSHGTCIEIFPALPGRWKDGSVRGLRLRGGITMDMEWKNGRPVVCRMKAVEPVKVQIRYREQIVTAALHTEFAEIELENKNGSVCW